MLMVHIYFHLHIRKKGKKWSLCGLIRSNHFFEGIIKERRKKMIHSWVFVAQKGVLNVEKVNSLLMSFNTCFSWVERETVNIHFHLAVGERNIHWPSNVHNHNHNWKGNKSHAACESATNHWVIADSMWRSSWVEKKSSKISQEQCCYPGGRKKEKEWERKCPCSTGDTIVKSED